MSEHNIKCDWCGNGPADDPPTTIHRVNPKGVAAIWRCRGCLSHDQEAALDSNVLGVVNVIESDNRSRDIWQGDPDE